MEIWIPYGSTEVRAGIRTESLAGLAEPGDTEPLKDLPSEVNRVTNNPNGTAPLGQIVERDDRVMVFSDLPSNTSSFELVNSIVLELCNIVSSDNITLMWRQTDPQSKVHIESIGGRNIRTTDLGRSSSTIETDLTVGKKTVKINSELANASVKILMSSVSFDPVWGYTGCKGSLLNLLDEETRIEIQRRSVESYIEKDPSGPAEAMKTLDTLTAMLGRSFAINVIPNKNGDVARIFAGALGESLVESQRFLEKSHNVELEKSSDILIVGAVGRPYDYTLYSSLNAVLLNRGAVKNDGAVILVAECAGGYGDENFRKWMSRGEELKSLKSMLKKEYEVGSEKAYFLRELHEQIRIYLVSVMPDYYARNIFKLRTSRTVDGALESALRALGKDSSVVVVPSGALTRTHVKPKT
jgi:nickel-dependent lactate racemase